MLMSQSTSRGSLAIISPRLIAERSLEREKKFVFVSYMAEMICPCKMDEINRDTKVQCNWLAYKKNDYIIAHGTAI